MLKSLFIIASKNFRDSEFLIPSKILKGKGIKTKVSSDKKGEAYGADGARVEVDEKLKNVKVSEYDAIIFVGGPGCLKHLDNKISYKIAKESIRNEKILGAICISPVILAKAGVLKGKDSTVWYNSSEKEGIEILKENEANFKDQSVVKDNNIITASGPKAAKEFGNEIYKSLTSK